MYVCVYAYTPEWCSAHTGPNESHFELKCDWAKLNNAIVKTHLLPGPCLPALSLAVLLSAMYMCGA